MKRSGRNLAAQHRRPRSCQLQHDAHVRSWQLAVSALWCADPEDWSADEREILERPIPAEHREVVARLC